MSAFFTAAATLIAVLIGLGLVRLLKGPNLVDRIMAVQLVGTGGAAVLLLLAAAGGDGSIIDVALLIALLAAFAAATFAVWTMRGAGHGEDAG